MNPWMKWLKKHKRNEQPQTTNNETSSQSYNRSSTPIDEQQLKELFKVCSDVKFSSFHLGNPDHLQSVLLFFCEGMVDSNHLINEMVIPGLDSMFEVMPKVSRERIENFKKIQMEEILERGNKSVQEQIVENIFSGHLILFIHSIQSVYSINLENIPKRTPIDANTEVSIRGPRDSFVESITSNIALIRKRIRSNNLAVDSFVIGKRSKTKVALLYLLDVIDPNLPKEAAKRLHSIDIDGITSVNQLETLISDKTISLVPLTDYTARPDFAMESLLNGRFVILVDGNPTGIIAPSTLTQLLKSPEDNQFNFIYTSFSRIIRFFGLIITLYLPGLYIALVSFHPDQIPFPLMSTIAYTRLNAPMSAAMEMFLVLILLEIFREAGARLPIALGQTITVVGGLIIGDAAIRAGIVSPSMIVVTAFTAVASSTLVNQSLSGSLSVLRFLIFFSSAALGMFGFLFGVIAVVLYISTLKSFHIPMFRPYSPITFKDIVQSTIQKPTVLKNNRPSYLNPDDPTRQGDP